MNYKAYLLLFILFMLIQSKIFIDNVLVRFDGSMDSPENPSQYGQVIQGIVLVLSYMCVIALLDHELL